MRYVFVDFEMNPINWKYTEQRKQYFQEIIEIGAVMLDEKSSIAFTRKYTVIRYLIMYLRRVLKDIRILMRFHFLRNSLNLNIQNLLHLQFAS